MTDEKLIANLRQELPYLRDRGLPATVHMIEELTKRFENLQACHRLLAERDRSKIIDRATKRI